MTAVYRVDTFVVPDDAREEFWGNVRRTHAVLREQAGFVDDVLLETPSAQGRFHAVTIVGWESAEHLPAARAAVATMHRARGFDAAAFFARAGIRADLTTRAAERAIATA
ncbi:MAG: hypothetical protein AB7J32_05705 [Pseudonocardia sp.]